MPRKRLLVLTSTFPRWANDSSPPFVFELSKRLTDDFEVTVLAPHYPGAPVREEREGLQIHRFRYFWERFETLAGEKAILPALRANRLNYLLLPFFLAAQFFAALRLAGKLKVDVIHAHWLLPQGLAAALIKFIAGTPFVVTGHGGDVYGLQGRLAMALKRLVLRRAAGVTVVSRALAEKVKGLAAISRLAVIPMGVDAALFNPELSNPGLRERLGIKGPFLLFVGRLSEKKGVRYLLEALPPVLKNFPETRLVVVGKGELADELQALAAGLGLAEKVIFTGAVPNRELPAYYASADIFIGPSVTASGGDAEGFGLTFVEAGLSGCVVVGTDSGGIGDIIADGRTGFLVREKNSADLTAVLRKILADLDRHRQIGRAARLEFRSSFDWEVIAARYREFLH
jgi:glycosyltransferase involved in cell wall biosynthesis